MRAPIVGLALFLLLPACGAEPIWAPDAAVARAAYVHDGPPAITLFTVQRVDNKGGAHSGLMINGAQRIIFDPAGTWKHPHLPERNDVFFGMTPTMVSFYIDYHARETFDVVEQTVTVSPEVAALAARLVQQYGAVPKAHCTRAVSTVLSQLPGFEQIGRTWYPTTLMEEFAQLPGVTSRRITDDDADDNHGVLLVQAGDPRLAEFAARDAARAQSAAAPTQ